MSLLSPGSWDDLRPGAAQHGELVANRIPNERELYVAVDSDGLRHFLIPIPQDSTHLKDHRSRGLQADTHALEIEGQPTRVFIDVVCSDNVYWDVFNRVISTVIELLDQGEKPVAAVSKSFSRWRRFWGSPPKAALSDQELRGLFAELWFLAEWLLPVRMDAIQSWIGPTGGRHDFQVPQWAVEVKSTVASRGNVHRIHGIEQLEPPDSGKLFLFSLHIREEPAARNSVPLLVQRTHDLLTDRKDQQELFEQRLWEVGYWSVHVEEYQERRYRVVDQRLYHVEGGFPRLTRDSFEKGIPAGVEYIEYDINLDVCQDCVVATSPIRAATLLSEGESCLPLEKVDV